MKYIQMSSNDLEDELRLQTEKYEKAKAKGLELNMERGIPCTDQIRLSQGMLDILKTEEDCLMGKVDGRTYNSKLFDGLPEAKKLFADTYGVPEEYIVVGGNSSLSMMYDTVARAMLYGVAGSEKPWSRESKIRFLCPVPGYDRHFRITQSLGIEMVNVPMLSDGPDMDIVEELVKDPAVKGIWCVPKYSNPTGAIYSESTVRRLASMKTGADDFRIFWDNAYGVHDFYEFEPLTDIFSVCREYGTEDRVFYFGSTSKISFPGAGVAFFAASENNLKQIKPIMACQTMGYDKLNMIRHIRFFKDADGILAQMRCHAAIMRPKFDIVCNTLEREVGELGIASWDKPRGGYFVSLDILPGTAKRTYNLAKEAGLRLTAAGATYPYGIDPKDRNLRIAPSYPTAEDLQKAMDVLCICIKIAACEKLLAE